MINSIEFYCGMSREMKALKCSEMCVKTDDMIELVSRLRYAESETGAILSMLRQAEKDAARYRWLRDEARHHMDGAPLAFMTNYDGEPIAYPECGMVLHESYLDEAIDEAMQCK